MSQTRKYLPLQRVLQPRNLTRADFSVVWQNAIISYSLHEKKDSEWLEASRNAMHQVQW
jgi:hypothetical protein